MGGLDTPAYGPVAHSLPAEAEIFALGDRNSVVTKNVVRRNHVKMEVRQSEIQEIVLSTRLARRYEIVRSPLPSNCSGCKVLR
jgi:hypothetical protein